MAASFTLNFDYEILYRPNDILYFGMNFILGCREFPLRFGSTPANPGNDISPRSSATFQFGVKTNLSINDTQIFDKSGRNDIVQEMLYIQPDEDSNSKFTFRMGSVGLRQVVEFNPNSGNLNDFLDDQFTEISNVKATVTIEQGKTTTLVGKPASIKLGKQHGEILLLSWESSS